MRLRLTLHIGGAVALVGATIGFLSGSGAAEPNPGSPAEALPKTERRRAPSFVGLNPASARESEGRFVVPLSGGSQAELGLHAGLMSHIRDIYDRYSVPAGAFVAIEPATGRVLAYFSHTEAATRDQFNPSQVDLAADPGPPAASVFKIVTAAALVEAGVSPQAEHCYRGGLHGLNEELLTADPARDSRCVTLGDALGSSINTVFGRLALAHLDPTSLGRHASAFGFGRTLPSDILVRVSPIDVPPGGLEFARTAAGFWHSNLSPVHGALIAATIANDGEMPRLTFVDRVRAADGTLVYEAPAPEMHRVVSASTARRVGEMMTRTVSRGTARQYFFDRRGRAFVPGASVAGKTGSLNADDPYRAYSWFVGYGDVEDPSLAVAALVINEPRWRIKASFVAREAFRYWQRNRAVAAD